MQKKFDGNFWSEEFKGLGYPVKIDPYPLKVLKEMKLLPPNLNVVKAHRHFTNDLLEVVVIEIKDGLSRGKCIAISRAWSIQGGRFGVY